METEQIMRRMRELEGLMASAREKRELYISLLNNELSTIKGLLDQAMPQIVYSNKELESGIFMVRSQRIDKSKLNEIEKELNRIKIKTIPSIENEIKNNINSLNNNLNTLQINYRHLEQQL